MRNIFTLFLSFLFLSASAQDTDKTVTLTVTGQGKTIDEAKTNALRSAIEQAFGAFISSNTTIIDDKLVKDEIVSVTNGNIQKYDIVDESKMPDGTHIAILKAIVSINKLTSFCASKGINAEFKGGLFAMNIALQELNEKSEKTSWRNCYKIISDFLPQCIDYKVNVSDPVANGNLWNIPISINVTLNDNFDLVTNQLYKYVKSVSLNKEEVTDYIKLNKKIFGISFNQLNDNSIYFLRGENIRDSVLSIPWIILKKVISKIELNNGIEKFNLFKYLDKGHGDIDILDDTRLKLDLINFPGGEYIGLFNFFSSQVNHFSSTKFFINNENKYSLRQFSVNNRYNPSTVLDKELGFIYEKNIYLLQVLDNDEGIVAPNFNIFGLKNFITISFKETRNLEEIKKINEYKIELKK